MAQFGGMEITNAGRNLIAKSLTGKILKFSRAIAGSGYLPEGQDVAELENVITPRRDMAIENISIPAYIGTAKISVVLSNKDLLEGFFLREIGLFALDPDTGQEILYGYCNAKDTADFLPGQDGPDPVYYRFDLVVVIDQAQNVTAIFAENPLHVTYPEVQQIIDDVYKNINARLDELQRQINVLSGVSIKDSIAQIKE